MKLNGNEYNLPEDINFGFIYKSNNMLKKNGSSMIQLLLTVESGDIFTALPLIGTVITGMNTNQFVEELDKHIAKGGSYDEILEDALNGFATLTTSTSFEGFMAAAMKIPEIVKAANL